jgi:hypothetical protein
LNVNWEKKKHSQADWICALRKTSQLCTDFTTKDTNTDKATLRVIGVCGLVVAVGLGVVSFLISSNDHRRLHPWMLISCQLSAY